MSDDPAEGKAFSLRRWSQRKHAARAAPAAIPVAPAPQASDPERFAASPAVGTDAPPMQPARAPTVPDASAPRDPSERDDVALPSLDSLTIDSDFTGFMRPGVDADLKRGALKKLFSDARFNVMDGLDVYIDDYSKPDPIDAAVVRTLVQARYIFNPPATRVNAAGHVEDVPPDEAVAVAGPGDPQQAQEPRVAAADAGELVAPSPRVDDRVPEAVDVGSTGDPPTTSGNRE